MSITTGRKVMIVFESMNEELSRKDWEITLSNPAYWELDGVRGKFGYVYAPSYPNIEQAYLDAGKEVYRSQDGEQEPSVDSQDNTIPTDNNITPPVHLETEQDTSEKSPTENLPQKEEETLKDSDFVVDDISLESKMPKSEEEVDNMEWPDLRKKAKYIFSDPIKSKEQAKQVLKDWINSKE